MITIRTSNTNPRYFRTFPAYADARMHELVKDGIEAGDQFMTAIVPRGASQRLASAVTHQGPITVAPGHHIGAVGVNQTIAPYADKVNTGTGIDGPLHSAVTINRPARSWTGGTSRGARARNGAMLFFKNGEEPRFRQSVKFRPSMKIQAGKNFHEKTYMYMRGWCHIRVTATARQLARFLARGER